MKIRKLLLVLVILAIAFQAAALSPNVVRLYFFYSPACLGCLSAKDYVSDLKEKYPLQIKYLNIEIMENYEAMLLLEKKYLVKESEVPEIFIGDSCLVGKREILNELEPKIKTLISRGGSDWPDDIPGRAGKMLIEERFESFTLLAVLSAGLIDGINPCAFATIVFFVSFLGFAGRKKREILLIGSFFTAAVFVTYLLIGFGAFRFLQALELPFIYSKIIYILVGIISLALGILNLYDYYRFRTGKLSEMTLQLPGTVKRMIHSIIRVNQASSGIPLIITALATGFLISILESICTGQIYLPTIVFIIKTQGLRARAISFLLAYNFMFILPLVLIFGLTLFGVASDWFGKIMKKYVGVVKLSLAVLLFGLGILKPSAGR
jgi:hypothetical protein